MSKIITFIAQDDHVWNVRPKPYPAAKNLPQWWKDIPVYINNENQFDLKPKPNVTVKRCTPTIDMLSAGYYVPLWADLLVKDFKNESNEIIKDANNNLIPTLAWATDVEVAGIWPDSQVNNFEIPEGYSKYVFKNFHGWSIKTPPGWSCMFIHPVAYQDFPFKTIPGIVDTDIFNGEINVPFVLKENFRGIIPNQTPMFQVIPFKREKWESEFEVKKSNQNYYDREKLYANIVRAYHSIPRKKQMYR